jgi:hypothetical protein
MLSNDAYHFADGPTIQDYNAELASDGKLDPWNATRVHTAYPMERIGSIRPDNRSHQ